VKRGNDEDDAMRTIHIKRAHKGRHPAIKAALLIAGLLIASVAWATLPPPTPAQQQAAAEKKAKADAQAAKDKASLAASMDAVSARWRSRAGEQGWKTHPAVAIAAAAPAAGAAVTAAGPANPPPAGSPGAGNTTPAGQAAVIPAIKSEKLGTAPPSEDVKKYPTQAQPKDAPPTVQKDTPKSVSKK
jgi:colicin import membrane protein